MRRIHKAGMSPSKLQQQASKDIREAARNKIKADKSAKAKAPPSESNEKYTHAACAVHQQLTSALQLRVSLHLRISCFQWRTGVNFTYVMN